MRSRKVCVDAVPEELKRERRWILWKYSKPVRGKSEQSLHVLGFKTNDPTTWLSFENAVVRAESDSRSPVSDSFSAMDSSGLTLTNVSMETECQQTTLREMSCSRHLYGNYPSGSGIKAILRGTIRENHNLRAKDGLPKREVYDGRQGCARFFTITVERYGDATEIAEIYRSRSTGFMTSISEPYEKAPKVLREAQKPLPQEDFNDTTGRAVGWRHSRFAARSRNRKKFERLFLGVWDDYDSQSEADAALVAMFRFYSRDVPQIDRLFRQSGLHRPKWGERRGAMTYGETTIRNILQKAGADMVGRPRNPRMQVLPAWYSKTLKGCGALGTRLADGVFPWYADDEGFCGRLTGAQLAREAGVHPQRMWDALPRLERAGIICIAASDGKVHEYRLALGDAPFITRFEPKPIVLKSNKARSTR